MLGSSQKFLRRQYGNTAGENRVGGWRVEEADEGFENGDEAEGRAGSSRADCLHMDCIDALLS
jgi:hypothetical protein